ncbi:MAG: hypothetical protein IKC47_00580, partial [Clostridia bacterium]|nr:hypothetical protein [Clostridia bacterium]
PTVCFATTAVAAGVEDIYLINPISVALSQDNLFVADKVSNQHCLLHSFDLTGKPLLVHTDELAGDVQSIQTDGDNLFVVMNDRFSHYTVQEEGLTLVTTYNVKNVVDVALRDDNLVVLLANGKRTNGSNDNLGQFVNGDVASLEKLSDTYYCMYTRDGLSYYLTAQWSDDGFSQTEEVALESKFDGMTIANGQALFFNKTSVVDASKHLHLDTDVDNTFVAVTGNDDTIVTISNKSANVYTLQNSVFVHSYTIGSDTVSLNVPAVNAITTYTLAKPLGYPANIVYKTSNADTSVDHIIDNASDLVYLVLDYPNSQNDDYYYVFVGDKFGWVKKSAATLAEDSKIQVIDTSVSNQIATYQGKLMSGNATYVYTLPYTTANMTETNVKTTLNQTATSPVNVTILQAFVASDGTAWYYVKYPTTSSVDYGFVLQGHVGSLTVRQGASPIVLEKENPHMKINASLSEGVSMYVSKDMLETNLLTDKDGNVVKLETNTKVGVITRLEEVSYVQVVYPNGTVYYGWVENDHLITMAALTTNTVVGITFISVAILLIVTTTAIVRKRQLKKQNPIVVDEE